MSKARNKHAIVIGAGMGGLAAAAAIAEFFDIVTVLERDDLPSEPLPRRGTPQSYHPHALLGGGQRAFGELFPGFDRDLARVGAVPYRLGLDVRDERPGYNPFPRRNLGWVCYAMSRALIEHTTRARVKQLSNVVLLDQCRVLSLLAADDGSVEGVECEGIGGVRKRLQADLVIDASARGSLTFELLKETGHPQPSQTSIGIDIQYATAVLAIPETPEWKVAFVHPDGRQTHKGGLMFQIEKDRWIAVVGELHGSPPPDDFAGFLAATQQLRTSTIYDVVRRARPTEKIHRFALPDNTWRHYERLTDFPRGLLPIGDAICRFNPIYGQGMTVAAMEARILRSLLRMRSHTRDPLAALGQAFFASARPLIEAAWSMSAIPDLVHPKTRGERPDDLQDMLEFGAGLLRLAAADPEIHKRMIRVRHLMDPPSVLRTPDVMRRVEMEMADARYVLHG
jgi:2-polyprenyl-6-methoxyphenol hydroxylase-like FAD-dependent oxidoreductase